MHKTLSSELGTTKSRGGLDVLSVGSGHLEIRFRETDVIEVERAKRIIGDMLKRGYSLFIPVGDKGELQRVKRFVASTGTYIIADGPTVAPAPISEEEHVQAPKVRPGRPRKAEKSVQMTSVKATVVGRSAGG